MDDAPIPGEEVPRGDPADEDSRIHTDVEEDDDEVMQNRGDDEEIEEDDGEDLMENMEGDYRAMPALDRYDNRDIDDDVEEENFEEREAARLRAERAMDRADGRRRARLPGALLEDDVDEEDRRPTQRRRIMEEAQAGGFDENMEPLPEIRLDLDAQAGPARIWVQQEPIQREIAYIFRKFLRDFADETTGELLYKQRMRDMCTSNKQSLEVDWPHLVRWSVKLALATVDAPKVVLDILHQTAKEVVLEDFPEFGNIHQDVFVRFPELSYVESLRNLRQAHLNKLVCTAGVVTRRTNVFPQLQRIKFDCARCGYVLGPFFQNTGEAEVKPNSCPQCQGKGPFNVNVQETIYRNYQKITLQEAPGSVQAGRLPRHKEVILLHDLIDQARPGEEITLVGVYTNSFDVGLNIKNGFPVFTTMIEANYINKQEDRFAAFKLTDEDKQELHRLARDPRIAERICKSIAPSIYGHRNIKTAIALALFGGQEKHPSGSHRLRGDINVLLLGDPGVAKSQFLKYVEKVAQRAVYTTGKGASAVGLTAAVQKDPVTREWTLEGGALVLADKGICLIDEFDKMNEQDRVSIHEAMEQQSISISKAGIVTSLQARCSVIAAANPDGGRYDASRTFAENVALPDPILSRFDILCVVKDVVDPVSDGRLAEFVVSSHSRSHPKAQAREAEGAAVDARPQPSEQDPDIIEQETLRKYIAYAKQNCHPKLQNADYDKIAQVYAELRRESGVSQGMPIAVRHLESIIRMSEAHAAMHLREYVQEADIDTAIRVLLESFISTQKLSVQKTLQRKFKRFVSHQRDFQELLLSVLQGLVREQLRYEAMNGGAPGADAFVSVPIGTLEERAREYNINSLQALFESNAFVNAGFQVDRELNAIKLPR
ncbi:g6292 [Coccomyxa elongata]